MSFARSLGGGVVAVGVVALGIVITNVVGSPGAPGPVLGVARVAATRGGGQLARLYQPPPPPAPARPSPPVSVAVLNDSRITGLAHRAAAVLRAAGWDVVEIGNLPGDLPATTVFYRPGAAAAAHRLAAQQAGSTTVAAAPSWLSATTTLVFVVTRYYDDA